MTDLPGRAALVEDEVLDWVERRIAARDAALSLDAGGERPAEP